MRKYTKKIIIAILAIIILSISMWRLWPHSFTDIVSSDEYTITSLACAASISGLNDDGTTFIDNYQLQTLTEDS